MVIGEEVLQKIESVKTCYDMPQVPIQICQSGLYSFYESVPYHEQKHLECILKQGVIDIYGPFGEKSKNYVVPPDIRDVRDVASAFTVQNYIKGKYCFDNRTIPWKLPILQPHELRELNTLIEFQNKQMPNKDSNVLDSRDVASDMLLERFNKGLYSFEIDNCNPESQKKKKQKEKEKPKVYECPYSYPEILIPVDQVEEVPSADQIHPKQVFDMEGTPVRQT